MDKDLTSYSAKSWFETDQHGTLLSLHWEQSPVSLQIGQSVSTLFEQAPHQLTNVFSRLSTQPQVSVPLPCRGLLLLLSLQKDPGRPAALGGRFLHPRRPLHRPQ